jgi:hypothetical protein
MPEAREIREELASVYAIRSHERFHAGQYALAGCGQSRLHSP